MLGSVALGSRATCHRTVRNEPLGAAGGDRNDALSAERPLPTARPHRSRAGQPGASQGVAQPRPTRGLWRGETKQPVKRGVREGRLGSWQARHEPNIRVSHHRHCPFCMARGVIQEPAGSRLGAAVAKPSGQHAELHGRRTRAIGNEGTGGAPKASKVGGDLGSQGSGDASDRCARCGTSQRNSDGHSRLRTATWPRTVHHGLL